MTGTHEEKQQMGLEDVTAEIKAEAEAEANEILAAAEDEKKEILAEAEEKRERILEKAKEEAEQEAAALRKKQVSSATMQARQMKQEARQDVLEAAFEAFRDSIQEMSESKEQELVAAALDDLSQRIEIGSIQTAAHNSEVAADYGDVEEADVRGVIVASADGSRQFDLTFDTVADRVIAEHRKDVSQVLFE